MKYRNHHTIIHNPIRRNRKCRNRNCQRHAFMSLTSRRSCIMSTEQHQLRGTSSTLWQCKKKENNNNNEADRYRDRSASKSLTLATTHHRHQGLKSHPIYTQYIHSAHLSPTFCRWLFLLNWPTL